VALFAITGQRVQSSAPRVARFANRLNVDTRGLAPGVYLLQVRGHGGNGERLFVVL
jgi:hypothetical protein